MTSVVRVRFSNAAQAQNYHDEDPKSIRERRLSARQRTESFKGDNKEQSWLRRQFSAEMSRDYGDNDGEFMTAIAAAAFAIFSLDERSSQHEKRTKNSAALLKQPSGRISRILSNRESKNAGETSMKMSTGQDPKAPIKPSQSFFRSSLGRYNSKETKADAWEISQLEKIKKRSEKAKAAIKGWENEKKMKEKLSLDKKKRELEVRKEMLIQYYKMKIATIDQIAGGARSQVDEKRRNDELVVKKKAKRIRSTGKNPVSCLCF